MLYGYISTGVILYVIQLCADAKAVLRELFESSLYALFYLFVH